MFRSNNAQDAPPQSIRVGGADYAVNVDFRVWIDILDRARELYASVGTLEEARHNARVLAEMQRLAFGRPLGRPSAAVLRAMMDACVGLAACSVSESACNAGRCTPLAMILEDA